MKFKEYCCSLFIARAGHFQPLNKSELCLATVILCNQGPWLETWCIRTRFLSQALEGTSESDNYNQKWFIEVTRLLHRARRRLPLGTALLVNPSSCAQLTCDLLLLYTMNPNFEITSRSSYSVFKFPRVQQLSGAFLSLLWTLCVLSACCKYTNTLTQRLYSSGQP